MKQETTQQLWLLHTLTQEATSLYQILSSKLGFSDSAFMILNSLYCENRPMTQKELCDIWSLKKQTIHSALNSLYDDGLVRIIANPTSERSKQAVLTPKGLEIAKRTVEPLVRVEVRAFERLPNEEQAQLIRLNKCHLDFLKEEFTNLLKQLDADNEKESKEASNEKVKRQKK